MSELFILGHLGITAGLAVLLGALAGDGGGKGGGFRPDLRLAAIGALLPDIIDKPLGHWVLADSLDNGRLLGHTLAFLAILLLVSSLRRNPALMAVSFGVAVHLGLDMMWTEPVTLFWPLHGFGFPAETFEVSDWFRTLVTDPWVLGGEVLGGLILAGLFFHLGLHRRGALIEFIRTGGTGRN